MTKDDVAREMRELQDFICNELEILDGVGKFVEDKWERAEGGGGRTRIIESDELIEKGGVNFSEVYGEVTPMMKQNTEITGDTFFATGVSIVLHPNNPYVPIIHMNVRYFEMDNGTYWFGGGIDLTPHYIVPTQAQQFHQELKAICDNFNDAYYPKFKTWADNYFFIPHRNETRGIGGIFFDHLSEDHSISKKEILNFCLTLGREFPKLYGFQANLGRLREFSNNQLSWMHLRRGRYVEFNLVHDRGTKFGLVTGGRTESILMSLPKNASWVYNNVPTEGSNEEATLRLLIKDIDWVNYS